MPTMNMRFLCVVMLTAGCSELRVGSPDDEARTHSTRLRSGAQIHLRTSSGMYLVAESGGGSVLAANRAGAGAWETFTVEVVGGGELVSGGEVRLGTWDGAHYVQADNGGGSGVNARSMNSGAWETFQIERLGGGGRIGNGDSVGLRASSGHFVVAELGGGAAVNANRPEMGGWETFVVEVLRESGEPGGVRPDDVELVPPQPGGTIFGTIAGYEMDSACPYPNIASCEPPMYLTYNRDTKDFWDIMVQELLHSRVNVVLAHGRGCISLTGGIEGAGNMCPRLLARLVEAIDRAGAREVMRLGMFDDTAAYEGNRNVVEGLPEGTHFDFADRSAWRFFWDHNMKIWFDTVPPDLWYRLDGRPVINFWSVATPVRFTNQRGNLSQLLRYLKHNFIERYGVEPAFIVDKSWVQDDPTVTTADAVGVSEWFHPPTKNFGSYSWAGHRWGAIVPGYRDANSFPGCGQSCREVPRRDGAAYRDAARLATARFALLEGWTNIAESAGYYRSFSWRYPNQYIEITRELSDPALSTVRLEAEAADEFGEGSPQNFGGQYRPDGLDVGRIPQGGWHVGWTEPGEWVRFKEVAFACGTYRFTARVASPMSGQHLRFQLGSATVREVAVPNTGSWNNYQLVHLGVRKVRAGPLDVTVEFLTGGVNLDWVFVKKASDTCNW